MAENPTWLESKNNWQEKLNESIKVDVEKLRKKLPELNLWQDQLNKLFESLALGRMNFSEKQNISNELLAATGKDDLYRREQTSDFIAILSGSADDKGTIEGKKLDEWYSNCA